MVDVGTGAKLGFGTSGFAANIEEMSWGGIPRESIPTSHLLTVGGRTFIVGKLYDPGDLTVDIQYDPDDRPPFDQDAEIITITYPIPAGQATGATHAATGHIEKWTPPTLSIDGKMMSTFVIKFSGDFTFADSA